jgi:aminoglycoside adenylyltransferase-like protein
MDDPRQVVRELTNTIDRTLGDSLVGVYLFGSIPAGGYYAGRSDIDLMAVVSDDISEQGLSRLNDMHAAFVSDHPDWDNRIEVGYVSTTVLRTLSGDPKGTIAVTSPGEPLHITEAGDGWVLNWHSVLAAGETILGPDPLSVGAPVSQEVFRRVLLRQIERWQNEVRERWIAHSRSYQGYILLAVCRALYGLETGGTTTKEGAATWAETRFPEWADFIADALVWHRSDLTEPHATTVRFVDHVARLAQPS